MKYSKTYFDDLESISRIINKFELLNNTRILVIGSTGLIGSAIVDFLMYLNTTKNYNITVYATSRKYEKFIERFEYYKDNKNLIFTEYDSLKTIDFNYDFDYVIYSAGLANPNEYVNHPVETMNSSYLGLNNILQYGINHKYKCILYVSSSEVYGVDDNIEIFKENDLGFVDVNDFRSCYPISKRACESLCVSYKKEYGIDYRIVRPGHVYGPTSTVDDNRVGSLFLRLAKNGEDIVLKSSGEQIRSYCYVLDVVSAIITVLLNGDSTVYNISNNESNVSIKEFAEEIALLSGVRVIYDKPNIKELSSFNKMNNSVIDNSKLLKLGWKAIFDLKTGLFRSLK